jgi:hypothetical protein
MVVTAPRFVSRRETVPENAFATQTDPFATASAVGALQVENRPTVLPLPGSTRDTVPSSRFATQSERLLNASAAGRWPTCVVAMSEPE